MATSPRMLISCNRIGGNQMAFVAGTSHQRVGVVTLIKPERANTSWPHGWR